MRRIRLKRALLALTLSAMFVLGIMRSLLSQATNLKDPEEKENQLPVANDLEQPTANEQDKFNLGYNIPPLGVELEQQLKNESIDQALLGDIILASMQKGNADNVDQDPF